MSESYELWERPEIDEIYMLAGWRQWADGGAISSGLPRYLLKHTKARQIGKIKSDGFYMFQLPGTQQFFRPVVRHKDGHSISLKVPRNEIYYTEVDGKGIVFFSGVEPHMDVERYVETFFEVVKELKIKRIVHFGGIYAEVPYDKERYTTSIFSMDDLREEVEGLTVELSNYHGPTSIGSYISYEAGQRQIESVGLYSFCPIYQFGNLHEVNKSIQIENDYMAWLGVMRRVNYMLKVNFDLSELEDNADHLVETLDREVKELDEKYPDLGVAEYIEKLRSGYEEETFDPLEDIWETELRRLGDQFFPPEDEE